MKNIADLIETVLDETGIAPRLVVEYINFSDFSGAWVAKIMDEDEILLDRNGQAYLRYTADTVEEALQGLDDRAA